MDVDNFFLLAHRIFLSPRQAGRSAFCLNKNFFPAIGPFPHSDPGAFICFVCVPVQEFPCAGTDVQAICLIPVADDGSMASVKIFEAFNHG